MTDPWCCNIWCAMDPINIPPTFMLAYILYIPAPWIRHGIWNIREYPKTNWEEIWAMGQN